MSARTLSTADRKIIQAGSHTWRDAAVIAVGASSTQQAIDFLQGYLTSDATQLNTNSAQPMALCNVQGRVVANGWALLNEQPIVDGGVCLLVHADLADSTVEFLTPYARFSRCSVAVADTVRVRPCDSNIGVKLYDDIHFQLLAPDPTADLRDGSPTMQRALVDREWVWVNQATQGQYLPHNIGLVSAGAVNFDKGCYLGQEIVARVEFRGKVKRQVGPFSWQGEPPALGEKLKTGATVVMIAHDADAGSTQLPSGTGLAVS